MRLSGRGQGDRADILRKPDSSSVFRHHGRRLRGIVSFLLSAPWCRWNVIDRTNSGIRKQSGSVSTKTYVLLLMRSLVSLDDGEHARIYMLQHRYTPRCVSQRWCMHILAILEYNAGLRCSRVLIRINDSPPNCMSVDVETKVLEEVDRGAGDEVVGVQSLIRPTSASSTLLLFSHTWPTRTLRSTRTSTWYTQQWRLKRFIRCRGHKTRYDVVCRSSERRYVYTHPRKCRPCNVDSDNRMRFRAVSI